jgi:hypothetical protein
MIKNLSFGKRLIYFLLILVIPISVFNFYTDIEKNRFSDKDINLKKEEKKIEKVIVKNFAKNQDESNTLLAKILDIKKSDFDLKKNTQSKIISI